MGEKRRKNYERHACPPVEEKARKGKTKLEVRKMGFFHPWAAEGIRGGK
jgi:hypothetical protein